MNPASIGGEKTGTYELSAYVLEGKCTISFGAKKRACPRRPRVRPAAADYLFGGKRPRRRACSVRRADAALEGSAAPQSLIGNASDITGEPFRGDPDARLRVLLPDQPAFDMAVKHLHVSARCDAPVR